MPSSALKSRIPWDDRWATPTLAQLLDPLKAQHRRTFDNLMEYIQSLPGVEREIIWYGPAWKWTIHYTLPATAAGLPGTTPNGSPAPVADAKSKSKAKAEEGERQTLCYLVPRVESPMISIPLSDDTIGHLPLARLSKFIRDGIKLAKCAVAIHWATWSPSTLGETALIVDLIKRRHKMFIGAEKAAQAAQAAATAPAAHAVKDAAKPAARVVSKEAAAPSKPAKKPESTTAKKPAAVAKKADKKPATKKRH